MAPKLFSDDQTEVLAQAVSAYKGRIMLGYDAYRSFCSGKNQPLVNVKTKFAFTDKQIANKISQINKRNLNDERSSTQGVTIMNSLKRGANPVLTPSSSKKKQKFHDDQDLESILTTGFHQYTRLKTKTDERMQFVIALPDGSHEGTRKLVALQDKTGFQVSWELPPFNTSSLISAYEDMDIINTSLGMGFLEIMPTERNIEKGMFCINYQASCGEVLDYGSVEHPGYTVKESRCNGITLLYITCKIRTHEEELLESTEYTIAS